MANQTQRDVNCYHCGAPLAVPLAARTVTCPACYKGLLLDDLYVRDSAWVGKLSTCGSIRIEKKARAVTRCVQAGNGIEVLGTLEAKVTSHGPVHLGPASRFKGDIDATSIVIEPGAVLDGARLCIRPKPVPA